MLMGMVMPAKHMGTRTTVAQRRAIAFLESFLLEGPQPSLEVYRAAEAAGISREVLWRAAPKAGVEPRKRGFNPSYWEWQFNPEAQARLLRRYTDTYWGSVTY
jgi:hypothetical protein